jgi:hypothetical protein
VTVQSEPRKARAVKNMETACPITRGWWAGWSMLAFRPALARSTIISMQSRCVGLLTDYLAPHMITTQGTASPRTRTVPEDIAAGVSAVGAPLGVEGADHTGGRTDWAHPTTGTACDAATRTGPSDRCATGARSHAVAAKPWPSSALAAYTQTGGTVSTMAAGRTACRRQHTAGTVEEETKGTAEAMMMVVVEAAEVDGDRMGWGLQTTGTVPGAVTRIGRRDWHATVANCRGALNPVAVRGLERAHCAVNVLITVHCRQALNAAPAVDMQGAATGSYAQFYAPNVAAAATAGSGACVLALAATPGAADMFRVPSFTHKCSLATHSQTAVPEAWHR